MPAAWSRESGVVASHGFPPAPYHPPVQPAVGCWPVTVLSFTTPAISNKVYTLVFLKRCLMRPKQSQGQSWCGLWSGNEGPDCGGAYAWSTRHNTRAQTCSCFGHCSNHNSGPQVFSQLVREAMVHVVDDLPAAFACLGQLSFWWLYDWWIRVSRVLLINAERQIPDANISALLYNRCEMGFWDNITTQSSYR